MSKSDFIKNSFILILSNLATSILGFMFSITLSKQLGPEGIGLYGLIRPINMIFSSLACGGLVTAVSKVSAEYYGKGDYKNFKRTIKTSMIFIFLWSLFITTLLFILSPALSTYIIKDERTLNALRILCPAIVFIAVSNCLKGYFYSTFKIIIPAFIDIFEKAIKIIILVVVINSLNVANVTTTVTAAYFVLLLGEIISFVLLYLFYKLNIKNTPTSLTRSESRAQLLFNTLSISLPLLLSKLVTSLLSTCSALLIPRRLVTSGIEYKAALGMVGKFNGMARNIVFFPMVIIESISILLIPDLSTSLSKKHFRSVDNRISKALELSFLLGAATLIISICIGDNLGFMFYGRKDLGSYIKFASLASPAFYMASATNGILNGLGRQKIILRNSILVSILRIFVLYFLIAIPSINIYGYGITLIITSLTSLILNLWEIRKFSHLSFTLFSLLSDTLIIIFTYFVLILLTKILPANMLICSNTIIILSGFLVVFLLRNFVASK